MPEKMSVCTDESMDTQKFETFAASMWHPVIAQMPNFHCISRNDSETWPPKRGCEEYQCLRISIFLVWCWNLISNEVLRRALNHKTQLIEKAMS